MPMIRSALPQSAGIYEPYPAHLSDRSKESRAPLEVFQLESAELQKSSENEGVCRHGSASSCGSGDIRLQPLFGEPSCI